MRALASLAAVLVLTSPLHARSDDPVARAQVHFEVGRSLYQGGRFEEAAREFAAGHALAPRPEFLLNLGQTYRKLKQFGRAREMYDKYLREIGANDPHRASVNQILVEIDRILLDEAARPPVAPVIVAAPAPVKASPPPRPKFIRRHWWIIPVSALALGGLAVGLVFGLKPSSGPGCGDVALGCVDANQPR